MAQLTAPSSFYIIMGSIIGRFRRLSFHPARRFSSGKGRVPACLEPWSEE